MVKISNFRFFFGSNILSAFQIKFTQFQGISSEFHHSSNLHSYWNKSSFLSKYPLCLYIVNVKSAPFKVFKTNYPPFHNEWAKLWNCFEYMRKVKTATRTRQINHFRKDLHSNKLASFTACWNVILHRDRS